MYALAGSSFTVDGRVRLGPNGERLGPDGRQLRACGAVRVSGKKQRDGHSPQTQREGIKRAAREYGYLIDDADIFEDTRRGHVLKRPGYQAIIRGIEEGKYHACFVFMFDRLGRASVERVARAHDWDKRGVVLISAQEGVDEPGVLRMVRIGMAEEESRRLALRVMPNKLKGAQMGRHQGRTPYGYVTVYQESMGQRPTTGMLVPKEPEASVVRDLLFARAATGEWSTRRLANDLNQRGMAPPVPVDDDGTPRKWTTASVHTILTNETYAAAPTDSARGTIVYGREKVGYYLSTPGLHVGEGRHVPLVSREVFDQVQERLRQARCRSSVGGGPHRTYWIAGLLRCAGCGGRMVPLSSNKPGWHGQLRCSNRYNGRVPCTAQGYRLDLAEAGLLDQVRRLRGTPWTPEKELLLAGTDGAQAAHLARELQQARDKLARANRRFMLEIDNPTPEDRAAFEAVRCEMGARIRELEQQQAQLAHDAKALPRLRALHERLTRTEIGTLIDQFVARGDRVGLRDLLVALVESATLVKRQPEVRSLWLRFEVNWSDDVALLARAGLLQFGPQPQPSALRRRQESTVDASDPSPSRSS